MNRKIILLISLSIFSFKCHGKKQAVKKNYTPVPKNFYISTSILGTIIGGLIYEQKTHKPFYEQKTNNPFLDKFILKDKYPAKTFWIKLKAGNFIFIYGKNVYLFDPKYTKENITIIPGKSLYALAKISDSVMTSSHIYIDQSDTENIILYKYQNRSVSKINTTICTDKAVAKEYYQFLWYQKCFSSIAFLICMCKEFNDLGETSFLDFLPDSKKKLKNEIKSFSTIFAFLGIKTKKLNLDDSSWIRDASKCIDDHKNDQPNNPECIKDIDKYFLNEFTKYNAYLCITNYNQIYALHNFLISSLFETSEQGKENV